MRTILLATVNVMTPTLQAAIGATEAQRSVAPRTWAACVLSLVSTLVAVEGDALSSADVATVSTADALVLAAAFSCESEPRDRTSPAAAAPFGHAVC